jgi:hypothetical protein
MKTKEILYLNDDHKSAVDRFISDIKQVMFYATEDEIEGKYQDFLNILDNAHLHSNAFHETTLKADGSDGVMGEFIFLIPNMLYYAALGFLSALKTPANTEDMMLHLESATSLCENVVGELADVLIDVIDEKRLLENIMGINVSSN